VNNDVFAPKTSSGSYPIWLIEFNLSKPLNSSHWQQKLIPN